MGNDVIQAQFEELELIARGFGQQAHMQAAVSHSVARAVEALQADGWQGRGAAAFFGEMNTEVLPAMRRLADALQRAGRATLQIEDVLQAAEEEAAEPFRSDLDSVDRASGKADGQLRITRYDKVSNGVPFLHDPGDPKGPDIHANDLGQGGLGDCYMVSALAAVADQNPALIRNAIHDNRDGTYTVTFYKKSGGFLGLGTNYKPVKVTVSAEFPSGERYVKKEDRWAATSPHMGLADEVDGKQELWPLLIEKAYAQWKGGGDASRGYAEINKGGRSSDVLTALTGLDSDVVNPHHYSLKELADKQANGYAMTISSLPGSKGKDDWYRDGTLVRDHAYWIDSVDEAHGMVTLRNPWGYGDSKTSKIDVKYEDLDNYFKAIHLNPLKK